MIFTHLGHSKFLIELENGMRIVTDPYDDSCGYPPTPVQADVALVSHHHHDHDAVETVGGHPRVLDEVGVTTLESDVRVTGIPSFHDEVHGAQRGPNVLFLLEAEGLRVAHLGDLGHLPDGETAKQLLHVDVLLIPVGGHFTVDASQAENIVKTLAPAVVVPMHYRTAWTASWPIRPVSDFTRLFGGAEQVDLLRVTAEDVKCQPHVAVLREQCGAK